MSDTGAPIVDRTARQLKGWYIAFAVLAWITPGFFFMSSESLPYGILFGLVTLACLAKIVVTHVRGTRGWRLYVTEAGIRLLWLPTGGWSLSWEEIGGVELRRRWLRPTFLKDPAYGYELRLTVPADFFRKPRTGRRSHDVYTAEIELSEVEAYDIQERVRALYDGPVRATGLPPAETGGPQQKLIRPPARSAESYWGDKPFGPFFLYIREQPGGGAVRTTSTISKPNQFVGFVVTGIGLRWNSFGGKAWRREAFARGFEITWAEIGTLRVTPQDGKYLVDIVPGDKRFAQRHPEMRKYWLQPDGTYRMDHAFTAGAIRELRSYVAQYHHPGAYEEVAV